MLNLIVNCIVVYCIILLKIRKKINYEIQVHLNGNSVTRSLECMLLKIETHIFLDAVVHFKLTSVTILCDKFET